MNESNTEFADKGTEATLGCLGWLFSLFGLATFTLFQTDASNNPERHKVRNRGQSALALITLGFIALVWGIAENDPRRDWDMPDFIVNLGVFSIIGGAITAGWSIHKLDQAIEPTVNEPVSLLKEYNVFTILLPRSTEWNPDKAWKFMSQLIKAFPYLVVRIRATNKKIYWQIINLVDKGAQTSIPNIIRSNYPMAEVKVAKLSDSGVKEPFYRYLAYYQQENLFAAPITHVTDIKTTERSQVDPLADFSQAVNQLKDGQSIRLTIGFLGSADEQKEFASKQITQSLIHPLQYLSKQGIVDAMFDKYYGFDRVAKYRWEDQQILEDKLAQPLYYVMCLLQIDAKDPVEVAELVIQTRNSLLKFGNTPFNAIDIVPRTLEQNGLFVNTEEQEQTNNALAIYARTIQKKERVSTPFLILEPRELAALWHFPHTGFRASRINWSSGAQEVSEDIAQAKKGIVLGKGTYQGGDIEVRLSAKDRNTHVGIIGTTGMGKSTLLHQMIHEDIAEGLGVALLDPHGTLVRDILRTSIPKNREQDVVVLDLAVQHFPVPLNPLHGTATSQSAGFVADIIETLFEGTENRVKVSKYLNAALVTLQADPKSTMRDIGRLFTDVRYRRELIEKLDEFEHAQALDVWRSLDRYTSEKGKNREEEQVYDFMLNRISPFYQKPSLLPILCNPRSLNFRDLMNNNKIILISLGMSRDQISLQERGLVGSIIISAFHTASFTKMPHKFAFYVDELEQFKTTTIDSMLRETRKYGMQLTVAHQDLSQLRGSTLDAVKSVGTKICFQSTREDATHFVPYVTPQFAIEDLVGLNKFTAVVKMQCNGTTQPAFTLRTLLPRNESNNGEATENRIRELSRKNLGLMSLEEVKNWHKERYGTKPKGDDFSGAEFYG